MTTEPYRPSNGIEGEIFIEDWCCRCSKYTLSSPCPITSLTFMLDIDHPNYPPEWVEDDDGPRCTAFEEMTDG